MGRWHENFDKKYNLPQRQDTYGVTFPSNLEDFTMFAFKTKREKEIQVGREYNFDPMPVGSCKVVYDEDSAAVKSGVKEGSVIFMKYGPINFLPIVDQYDRRVPNGKSIIKGSNLPERVLRQREKSLITSFV